MQKAPKETMQSPVGRRWLSQFLPISSWLPSYQRGLLRPDLLAGATVWAVTVPEAIAYAQLAGVPAQMGLFAAPFLMLGYVLFGTSRQLMVGATSASAIMLATTAGDVAGGNGGSYLPVVTGITLLVGLLLLLLGLARLGFVKNFLAEPVLTGFVFGLALVIGIGQVPKLVGLQRVEGNFFAKVWEVISHLGGINGWTLILGLASLALLFLLERFWPRIPASLVVVLGGILVVSLFHLERAGVAIVGTIPGGLPLPTFPILSLHIWLSALPGSFGIVLVIYAEHISAAQQFANKYHYDLDANQELLALGVANLGAGFFRGFLGGGSLSRSTVNDAAGGRTQVVGLVTSLLVIVTLLVLTPLFHNLPDAVLGAIILHAIWGLLRVNELRRYAHLRHLDLALALVALFGVLIFDILPGLLLAVVLSLVILIYRASRPNGSVLGRVPGSEVYGDIARHPENETVPGLLIFRLNAPLFFANSALMRERVKTLARNATPPTRAVLLDLQASSDLDISSVDMLAELAGELQTEGIELLLTNARGPVRDMLRRSQILQRLGEQHLFASLADAVAAFQYPAGGKNE